MAESPLENTQNEWTIPPKGFPALLFCESATDEQLHEHTEP